MLKKFFTVFGGILSLGITQAQNRDSIQNWVTYMLEPQPNYYKVKNAFYQFWGDSIPSRSFGYKVFKRWEWRALQNMANDGSIVWPQQQLTDVLAASSSQPKGGGGVQGVSGGGGQNISACPQAGRWSPVGPTVTPWNQTGQPTGIGRIAGMAFHPTDSNTFFVCAPQGGVWKTSNHGKTWLQLFGTGPNVNTIGATSMLLSYNNPDTMYVGTGDRDAGDAPGYGVIASWNGGKTWVSRNSGMGNYMVGRMIMHPKNSAIMLAATNNGIYRTTNGGASWSQTLSGGAWDVAFKPTDPSIVYAVINALFYRSTDNGQSWTQITSGLPSSGIQRGMLSVTAADKDYVYLVLSNNSNSGFYGFYQSTDAGLNFSTKSTTPNILGYSETGSGSGGQGWYDLDVAASPFDKSTVYVYGINVWKSTDGGANWSINAHWVGNGGADDIHADQHSGEFGITGRKLYAGNDGGIYYSSDGGKVWKNLSDGIQNSQIYRLAQAQTDPFVTAQGYQDNGSAQSQQDQFYTYYGGDGMDCAVDPADHSYVYGSYVYGRIYRAINKNDVVTVGANGTNGINESGGWLTPFVLQEGNPSRMFAGYTNVWRCDNVKTTGTISWTRINTGFSGSIQFLENSPADNQILYAINGSGLLYRTDNANAGGPTWFNISGGQPSGLRKVEAHHKNKNIVYGCNSNTLYRSVDKGASWSSIASISSVYGNANCLVIDTSAKTLQLYVGTEKGVLLWDSASGTLNEFNSGFPVWADVTDLEIHYSSKGKLSSTIVASTYGRGVWRSNLWEDGTFAPKAGFYAFDSVFVVGSKMHIYEKIKGGASAVLWKISPYTYSYADKTDSLSLNPIIQFNTEGLYSVTLIASNCQGTDTASKKLWIKVFKAVPNVNCKNTTTYSPQNYGIGIMRVSFSDNSNETGGYHDDGENIDFTANKIFRVKPSTTYSIKVKTGLYYNEYARLYLDYDNNGKFENFKGEVSSSSYGYGERTISVTMPSKLPENVGFRMRILSDYNPLDTNACKNVDYGQGEDYTLVNEQFLPLFKVSKTAACQFENLIFTDTSKGFIGSYDWDFGSGAIPSSATGKGPHTVKYATTGNKSVRLRINGNDSLRKNNYVVVSSGIIPIVLVKSGSPTTCEESTISLAARSQNGGTFTVQWQKNGVDISGKTDSILTLNNIKPADAGKYRAIISNGGCNAVSSEITIVVNPLPQPVILVNNGNQCQRYHRFDFQSNSSISAGYIVSQKWNFNDGKTDTSKNPKHQFNTPNSYNVKLTVTSNFGCTDSAVKTVNLYHNATPFFTVNDSDQCLSGNSLIATNKSTIPSGSLTYLWQFGDGNTSTNTSPTKSYSASGIFNILLISTSNNNCKDTFKKPVRIYSTPILNFGLNSSAQCFKGNYFTTTNSSTNTDGTLNFTWTFGDGSNSSQNAPSHSYSSSGNYNIKLKATSSFGCSDSLTKGVNVYPQPKAAFMVNDSDQCLSGNNFLFSNKSTLSSGSLTYTWKFGDGNTSASTNPSQTYSGAGTYQVLLVASSNQNCKDSASHSVRVYSQPLVSFAVNNQNQCLKGNNFVFTNNTTNQDGTLNYMWTCDGKQTNNPSLSYKFTKDGNFVVKLVATTSYGCADSVSQAVGVYPQFKLSMVINDSDQCASNNLFVFTNKSSITLGSGVYRWSFGDGNTSTAASPQKSYLFSGIYPIKLVGISNYGCSDTLTSQVRVYSQPQVDFSIDKAVQCFRGNRFAFANQSTDIDGVISSQWQFEPGATSNVMSPSYSFIADGDFNVKLVATTSFGCKDSISKLTTVFPQAVVAFEANDTSQCFAGNSFNFTNKTTLKTGSISGYAWRFGDGSQSIQKDPMKSYASHGIYKVQLWVNSNGICYDSISSSMHVFAQPKADFTLVKGSEYCLNYNAVSTINKSTIAEGAFSTHWNNGDGTFGQNVNNVHHYASEGSYLVKLIVVSDNNCTDSMVQVVKIHPSPVAKFATSKNIFCEDEWVQLTNLTTLSAGTLSYRWHMDQGDSSALANPETQYPNFGKYTIQLEATSNLNCKDSFDVPIEVASNPVANFEIIPSKGCAGQTNFLFRSVSTNADGRSLKYNWDFGNGNTDSGMAVHQLFQKSGNYKVKLNVRSPICSADTASILVVSDPVLATFVMDSVSKETMRFSALDSNKGGYTYFWNFGDGAVGYGQHATHRYLDNQKYQVRLIVANDFGCIDTNFSEIKIKSPNYLNQNNALNFYLYPNPTNGEVTYKFATTTPRDVEIKVFDILGQKPLYVKTWKQVDAGVYFENIDLKRLGISAGTYPVIIRSGEDELVIKLIFTP